MMDRIFRASSHDLDQILGREFPVGPDGFVRAVDYMGTDHSVVRAARISYGAGTRRKQKDKTLLRYLMRHHHTTPFEQATITLHVRAPMDVWRQWIRHRTMSVNEYSTRYSEAIDAMARTAPSEWRRQSEDNRQGSGGRVDHETGLMLTEKETFIQTVSLAVYKERIEAGVAREQARKDLPLSTYTEAYIQWDLHNLLHFLELRMDDHAQQEIREFATTIATRIVRPWVPVIWEAFEDYRINAVHLTACDVAMIKCLDDDEDGQIMAALRWGLLEATDHEDGSVSYRATREGQECADKLMSLGLRTRWSRLASPSH